jgi:hypothetical protein
VVYKCLFCGRCLAPGQQAVICSKPWSIECENCLDIGAFDESSLKEKNLDESLEQPIYIFTYVEKKRACFMNTYVT